MNDTHLELYGAETLGFSQRVCCDLANGSAASFLLFGDFENYGVFYF
jgi:hypothetical protein